MMKTQIFLVLAVALGSAGCESLEQRAAKRTDELRALYPAGKTTREDVQTAWAKIKPDLALNRPDQGWNSLSNPYLAEKMQSIETRMGKEIKRVERYWGPDGFFSLCYCWYYYDAEDKIVDVEWQYKSD